MRRTNIYLNDNQCAAVERLAREEGVSRAQVIRRLIDQGLDGTVDDLASDLAAITASHGILAEHDFGGRREPDDRWRYLERLAR